MILVDANLLIYSVNRASPKHGRASEWLNAQLGGSTKVGFPRAAQMAFLRIVTNPRIYPHPMSIHTAWNHVRGWLMQDTAWIPDPTGRHLEVFGNLLMSAQVTANLVTDAHLAALAIEHGLTLCSADGDFARFKGLRWHNPLA